VVIVETVKNTPSNVSLEASTKKERKLLMGNEAIAYGALESGVAFATGYPGTPSTEVVETIAHLKPEVFAEWAPNEKVGLEEAAGVAYTGLRALVTMKCVGLNVAADPLMSLAYSGVEGGMVILVADDPGPHTSQTEQDDRYYGKISLLPVLEPTDPQEAHDLIKYAYELSEKYKVPVIFRTTTRVNHTTADVEVGEFIELDRKPVFKKDIERYVRASMEGNRKRHTPRKAEVYGTPLQSMKVTTCCSFSWIGTGMGKGVAFLKMKAHSCKKSTASMKMATKKSTSAP
jgi:indolepyruvate ferredoxin oxidoreductase alpha subunit